MKRKKPSVAAKYQWWLTYAIVALTPVLVLRSAAEPFHLPKATFIIVAAAAAAVVTSFRVKAEKGVSLVLSPFTIAFLAYLCAAMAVTLISAAPPLSLWGEYRYFTGLILLLAVALVVLGMLPDSETGRYRRLVFAIVIGATPVVSYGLVQLLGADPFEWSGGAVGAFSTMGNPNFLAGYLAIAFPVMLVAAALPRVPEWWRISAVMFAVLTATVAIGTQSAQGPAALLVGAALPTGLIAYRRVGRRAFGATIAGLAAVLVIAGAVSGSAVTTPIAYGFDQRSAIWRGAISIFLDNPMTGNGLATFGLFFSRHRPAEHALTGFVNPEQAHNVALNHLAEGGLLLFIPWLAAVASVAYLLYRGLRVLEGERQLLIAGFGGAWLAYHAQGFVSIDLPVTVLLHWVLAAAIAGLAALPGQRRVWSQTSSREGATYAAAAPPVAVVIAVALTWLAMTQLRADVAAVTGFRDVNRGDVSSGVEKLEMATDLAPVRSTYWLLLAAVREATGDPQGALEAMEHAAAADAGSSKQALQAGAWADRIGELETAAAWYDEAIERDPLNPQVLERAAAFYDSVGETERAAELRRAASEILSLTGG